MFLRQVTISLAMTIVSLLATLWTIIHLSPNISSSEIFYAHMEYLEDNRTEAELLVLQHFAVSRLCYNCTSSWELFQLRGP